MVECKIWQMVLCWTQDAQYTFEKEECSEQLKVFHEYDKTGELVDWEEFYNLYNKWLRYINTHQLDSQG